MNKTEAAWAGVLEMRGHVGEVLWWRYESITLKLGHDCRYTPDMAAMLANGEIVFYEVKGFMREDALAKLKVAARDFPFRIILVTKDKAGWHEKEIEG